MDSLLTPFYYAQRLLNTVIHRILMWTHITSYIICDLVVSARWTDEEKKAVHHHLGHLIQQRRVPRKHECVAVLQKEPTLHRCDWQALKHYIASKSRYARLRYRKTVN